MIYFEKTQPAPACLAVEKKKKNGDYKCGDVLERLRSDFKNKCYICETKAPYGINVEHFIAHQNDLELKFDWNDLFFVCPHCNNIKLHIFDNILNCTILEHQVEQSVKLEMNPFPFAKVKMTAQNDNLKTKNTAQLLERIYNGHTPTKRIEAANIRSSILNEIMDFQSDLVTYFETEPSKLKELLHAKIENHLSPSSAYTAFKRWIIRDNPRMLAEFADLLK